MSMPCVREQKDSYWQQWMATKYSSLSSEHYPLHCTRWKLSTGNPKNILSKGKINCMPLYSNIFLVRSNFTEVDFISSIFSFKIFFTRFTGAGVWISSAVLWASVQGFLSLVTKQVLDNGTLSIFSWVQFWGTQEYTESIWLESAS